MQIRFRPIKDILADYRNKNSSATYLFAKELREYIQMRLAEAPISKDGEKLLDNANTIFGKIIGFSARLKISAAAKLLQLLEGNIASRDIIFTSKELEALVDKRLGAIIKKYQEQNRLPACLHEQLIENNSRRYFSSNK